MIRWAVSGSGNMASQFIKDCNQSETGLFVAVYSQSAERAQTFAEDHELAHHYCDFARMLDNPDIDAVYIASTHPNHAPQAIAALNAGKHVLVEKPMALSKAQAAQVFEAAKDNGKLCCEALWTKFSPTFQSFKTQLEAGKIGELRHIHANFGFAVDTNPKNRLLNPEHAGGALLDIGLYPIFLPLTLFGLPDETLANVTIGDTGVDIAADLIMKYNDGRSAALSYRFDAMMPTKAIASGTKGWVELDAPFFAGADILWGLPDQPNDLEHIELTNIGWGNEFEAVNLAINQGRLETHEHTWEDSLQLAEYLEQVRKTWGPTYPFEA